MPALTQSNIGGPPPVTPDLPTGGNDGGDNDRYRPDPGNSRQASLTGIVVTMCASTMTFAACVSAMVVRRGLNNDWHKLPLPHVLWWNTAILLLSSVAIDVARRRLKTDRRAFNWLWSAGALTGTGFLIGQALAWKQLEGHGFYLKGNPSSAFFYVLTWAHAAHVIGALIAVYYVEWRALRFELGPNRRTLVDVTSLFWHFLDVMWLGIMALFVWWA